jgi:hypothetical protein
MIGVVRRLPWVGAVVATTAVYAVVALGSDAIPPRPLVVRSHPPVAIVVSPMVQTLEARIVARIDPKTHSRRPTLVLGRARFRISVANENSVVLTGIRVTDPLSPGCNRIIGTLAPGASVGYICSGGRVGKDYRNVVAVSGRWLKGARVLSGAQVSAAATATARVKVKPKTKHHAYSPVFKPPTPKIHHAYFPLFTG